MKIRSFLHCAVIIAATQFCSGEVKEETISADQVGKAANPSGKSTEYKLELKDATLSQVVEAFNKMANTNVRAENIQTDRKPEMIYDINIKSTSLDDALDDLGRQIQMGIYNGGDALRISPGNPVGFNGRNRENFGNRQLAGTAAIGGISINENLNGDGSRSRSMSVNVNYYTGETGIVGSPKVTIVEATDDQGRNLVTGDRSSQENGRNRTAPFQGMGVGVNINYPETRPQKISHIKAEVSVNLPKTFKRYIVTGMSDNKVDLTINGVTIQVGPVVQEGQQWMVKIRQPQNARFRMIEDVQAIRVFGDTGSAMYLMQNGWSGDGRFMEANMRLSQFSQNFYTNNNLFLPKPTSLVWDIVDEVEVKTVTVEANNIAIP